MAASQQGRQSPVASAQADGDGDADAAGDDDAADEEAPKGIEQQMEDLRQELRKMQSEMEARKKLEVTEEEKEKKAEDILTAAGREYTLIKKGNIGLEYSLNYSYFSGDVIKDAAVVEKRSNHNITNQVYTEYGLKENLSVNATLPFCYKFNKVGSDASQEASDLGDVSVGMQYQPYKAGGDMPVTILSAGASFPTGSSPYKINTENSLATGAGFYSLNAGASLSKTIDPLVAFANLIYTYSFEASDLDQNWSNGSKLTSVDPGSSVALALGFGYALSYKASLNMSAQFAYNYSNVYHFSNGTDFRNGSSTSATFNIGTGWRITPARSISLKLGIGLTNNDPDFSFTVRVPFEL
ncbi:hypothetical protein GMSM_34090 [Geomonas sp. Red276]